MKHLIITLFFLCGLTVNAQTTIVTGPKKPQTAMLAKPKPKPANKPTPAKPKPQAEPTDPKRTAGPKQTQATPAKPKPQAESTDPKRTAGPKQTQATPAGPKKAQAKTAPRKSEVPARSPQELRTETFTVKGVSFKMCYVKGGTFLMGATSEQERGANEDESPIHNVTLSSYYIGQTEVTQALWQAVMGNNPSYFKGTTNPVERVSRDDCQDFILKLNSLTGQRFRLPTEAEWEFAARGGNKSMGYQYSGSNNLRDVAWFGQCNGVTYDNGNSGENTHPVATKAPNELGIYDMSGNVWEWCQDWYGSYSSSAQTDPQGPSRGSTRVVRGGCWLRNAGCCRSAFRFNCSPDCKFSSLGLRLVLSE